MRELMKYDTDKYQLRQMTLLRMLEIIQSQKDVDNVFFGDSIIQYFPIEKYLSSLGKSANCGIAGITSDILLNFIDEGVLKFNPQRVFIMIGTNDLGNTIMASPRSIALNVKEMVEIIHQNLVDTKIILLSCIPCLENQHGYKVHPSIRSNDMLKMIFKEYKKMIPYDYVEFINIYPCLCNKKGQPIEDIYIDGLHIKQEGYQKISQQILEEL